MRCVANSAHLPNGEGRIIFKMKAGELEEKGFGNVPDSIKGELLKEDKDKK